MLFRSIGSLPLAILAGYFLARRSVPGKWLLDGLINLPLVMPPVVTGYLLLILFSPRGPIGGWLHRNFDWQIVFTWQAAALASAVVSFPLMVRAIRLAIEGIDPRLEMVGESLGASKVDTFFSITLPLSRRGILAGCVLGFARGLGEFGATMMVAGNIVGETQTIPVAIYSLAQRPGTESQVGRLVVLSIALATVALVSSEWLERRRTSREST